MTYPKTSLLQGYAKEHNAYQRVKQYVQSISECKDNARDELAHHMLKNVKLHYRYLKEEAISIQILKEHSQSHLATLYTAKCNTEELTAFKTVKSYHEVNHNINVFYAKVFQNHDSSTIRQCPTDSNKSHFSIIQEKILRHKLAKEILSNVAAHESALDFYKIGRVLCIHTSVDKKLAIRKWYALQDHAYNDIKNNSSTNLNDMLIFSTNEINQLSNKEKFENALLIFLQMEIEQQSNIVLRYSLTDKDQRRELGDKIISQAKIINEFSLNLHKNPIFHLEIEKTKSLQTLNVAKQVNWKEMEDRLKTGMKTPEDIKSILLAVKQRALNYQKSISENQYKDRTQ